MKKLLSILFSSVLFSFSTTAVYAATDVSIVPSSGEVEEDFYVNIAVDTNEDEINAIEVVLGYSENLEYVSGVAGNLTGCGVSFLEENPDEVTVICFIPPGSTFNGTGNLARLNFSADSLGMATIDIESIDLAGGTAGNTSGASLTVVESEEPEDPEDSEDLPVGGDVPTLPQTSLDDQLIGNLFLGIALLISAAFIYFRKKTTFRHLKTVVRSE